MKNSVSNHKNEAKIAAVDLFCGAGGLSHGLLQESIVVKAGIDIDKTCQYAYEANNKAPYIIKDVADVSGSEILDFFDKGEIKVLAGCAPCQPFSTYNQGKDVKSDQKWGMLYEFSRLIDEVEPEIVTMENVPKVVKHDVYLDFVQHLEHKGYHVHASVVFCPDYGIPQTRQRLVLLASKIGEIKLIEPTHQPDNYKKVIDAIGHLPAIKHGQSHKSDPLHKSSQMSELNYKRIKASKPNGSWLDWDKDLIAKCHQKEGRETYRSVYGRMSWEEPSPTITTQFTGFGNGRFGHPKQHRALSLREGAILQTFPEDYAFTESNKPVVTKHIAKMIGNAVPVDLGKVIGLSIQQHVDNYKNNAQA